MATQDHRTTACVVVEAGDEPWGRLMPLLARRRAELPDDGVLEVRLNGLDVLTELAAWCEEHPPLHAELGPDGAVVRLRTAPHPTTRRTA
ncbi:hypothetical protein [Isoptericola haloaureus]|uniref:Sulfurtransferase TusA family protein n=1 Tax=Isoptericola haloaureus TaxID=1542902 RepID=A0ABU7Z3I6_9MICO